MFLTSKKPHFPLAKVPFKGMTVAMLSLVFLFACSRPQAMNKVAFDNQVSVLIKTQKQYLLGEAVTVSFTIKNGTNKPIQLLKWGTPLEGRLTGNRFKVTNQNIELPYRGRVFKRVKPQKNDFITLQPLTSLEAKVNLTDYYPISRTGHYILTYRTSYLSDKNTNSLIKLNASNQVSFMVNNPHN